MASFDKFISSLERDFGPQKKGKKFEVFCKWFLQNDPQWSRVVDEVWHFEEYPDKWQTTDLGTDLVFRDKQGEIWAVQVKCFNEKYSTKKDDMNTFLADSGRKQVSRRLWLHTTNKIDAKALQTSKDQEKPVIFFNLDDFREAEIDYPESFGDLFQAKVKATPTPDKHQEIAIQDAVEGFKQADRGQLIMACGTGKTFTTLWIKEALEANSTLVLLPSLGLLSQTLHEWAWAGNAEFGILNVCSDKSVGKDPEDLKTTDAPFRVTSDIEEIQAFLENPNPKVLFCTYQSSGLIAEVQSKKSIPAFDLVIADEAHRCAGKVSSDYATVLDEEKIRADKRLFTTATPRFISQSVKTQAMDRDTEILDMNDIAVFGGVFHKLTFGEAIHYDPEPLLNDYQVLVIGVDEPMVKKWIKNYELVNFEDSKTTDARTLAAKIAVIKAMKDYDLKRIISFHSKIDTSKSFSETFLDTVDFVDENERPTGVILADHVSGKMKASDRKAKIKRLKKLNGIDRGLLANARCLSEGVDVPSLDGVAFIDPKGSQVDIIQSVGRAIRKVRGAKTQTKGTIILPVFLEGSDDPNEVINKSNFKPVWSVLKALKSHDDELSNKLDEYRINLGKNPTKNIEKISDKIIFDLPTSVDQGFSDALRTLVVEATTESWQFWFGLLEKFIDENYTARVPAKHITEDGYHLGVWCETQRANYRDGKLAAEKEEALNKKIDQGWVWSVFDAQRQENIDLLRKYFEAEGHTLIQDRFIDDDGNNLGNITKGFRQSYSAGKLEKKWIDVLQNELNFKWDVSQFWWLEQYKALRRWFRKNPNSNIPQRLDVEIKVSDRYQEKRNIGLFRQTLVTSYKYWELGGHVDSKRTNSKPPRRLTQKQIRLVEAIPNWTWTKKEDVEEKWRLVLKDYCKKFGSDKLKINTVHQDYAIGVKVTKLRTRHRKNTLDQDTVDFLGGLGVSLDPFEDKWNEWFLLLERYVQENGSSRTYPSTKYKGRKLGVWVSTQRANLKRNRLDKVKIEKLSNLSDWTWDATPEPPLDFNKARKFARSLGLNGFPEWVNWSKSSERPSFIPNRPDAFYKKQGWAGWGDWLGSEHLSPHQKRDRMLSYEKAKRIVRQQKLKSQKEYKKWFSKEKPSQIPSWPPKSYKELGWIDWYDWLGTERPDAFLSFHDARKFARSLGFTSASQWRKWLGQKKRPSSIPAAPEKTYKDKGWVDYNDWLGSGKKH